MELPSLRYPPSKSGMRWFHTPKEYLADWKPQIHHKQWFKNGEGDKCPKCGNTRTTPTGYNPGDHWKCRKWYCGYSWPMTCFKDVVIEMTQEEWVLARIQQRYINDMGILRGVNAAPQGLGFWGSLGVVNALSSDPQTSKDGMVLAGLTAYNNHQKGVEAQFEARRFRAEAEQAVRLADAYFGITKRENARALVERAKAAQRARAEEDDRMVRLARQMAREMFDEAERRRAEGYANLTRPEIPEGTDV